MPRDREWNVLQREREQQALSMADEHLDAGRARIRRQVALLRDLRASGHDTAQAVRLLALLRDSVAVEREHRHLIQIRLATLPADD
ncbi:hypothetical protein VSR17_20885 [Cupriavidus taiwanensis]|uniref:hypothetical protein n=1 Tax=Cupriavidus taiwanensis TaxID=164546 RepID=UPI000E10A2E2|nr:hypothetical protein [Cupriavidus taiwanensis]SOY45924.1 conserved hypothetical protein [Cupriavidus taiwanensis]SOY81381.1 conserved hypothetical protein [Cupriavidus taiwanensis]SOZ78334.1 conserved hypothetical protein [Cupriavidus taiwanensis]SOZ84304.1 conserved hypothetical protein [Cupriavidus taiwanensis]SPA12504.1 conserved hypothetical protein [Cupriavidus taiwanensis]